MVLATLTKFDIIIIIYSEKIVRIGFSITFKGKNTISLLFITQIGHFKIVRNFRFQNERKKKILCYSGRNTTFDCSYYLIIFLRQIVQDKSSMFFFLFVKTLKLT